MEFLSSFKIIDLLLIHTIIIFFGKVSCLRIVESPEPISIRNGSLSTFVLDCPYDLEEGDGKGLVVKWFYSNLSSPIYQWIAGNLPQDSSFLTNRVDLSYEASDDEFKKYRALAILNPTWELTGRYKCSVSDYLSDHFVYVVFTVYAQADEFSMNYTTKDDGINVYCHAEGLYPKPDLALLVGEWDEDPDNRNVTVETDAVVSYTEEDDNTYSATIEKFYSFEALEDGDNNYLCVLTINETDYLEERQLTYQAIEEEINTNESFETFFLSPLSSDTTSFNDTTHKTLSSTTPKHSEFVAKELSRKSGKTSHGTSSSEHRSYGLMSAGVLVLLSLDFRFRR